MSIHQAITIQRRKVDRLVLKVNSARRSGDEQLLQYADRKLRNAIDFLENLTERSVA